jgi:hypothetical protein
VEHAANARIDQVRKLVGGAGHIRKITDFNTEDTEKKKDFSLMFINDAAGDDGGCWAPFENAAIEGRVAGFAG